MKSYENMSRIELIMRIHFLERRLEEKQQFVNMLINRIYNLLNFDNEEVKNDRIKD